MKKIEWTDDLSVGVNVIDDQHKQLIQHLNNLSKAVEQHQGPSQIGATLGFLIDYTDFHFSAEEKQMEESNYPGLENQKVLHAQFKKTLADLEQDLREEGATHELAGLIDTLLVNWLIKHICSVDVEFGDFLKNK
jgi:hemerythrin